jgi:hypothetical protein
LMRDFGHSGGTHDRDANCWHIRRARMATLVLRASLVLRTGSAGGRHRPSPVCQ